MKDSAINFADQAVSKVPQVTLGFWVIKVAATTLGETGGDWVSMSLKLGFLSGSSIFLVFFIALVSAQITARNFRPFLYWATIIATTTLGTTMADFADRSLGIGYPGGVALVVALLAATLGDLLDKPVAEGGLHISRLYASGILLAFIIAGIVLLPQRSARREPAV